MTDDDSRSTYLNILAEIKHRLDAVSRIASGAIAIQAKVAEESCILQFRFVAELIALGCLILHRDAGLSASGKLDKAWNASQIFKRLEKLHPDFYPQPLDPNAPDKFKLEEFSGIYMSKDELIRAYDQEFGASLHRGNVRRIFRDDPPLDFPKIQETHLKFRNLLNRHMVVSADREYLCHFNMCPIGEQPTCTLFGFVGDAGQ